MVYDIKDLSINAYEKITYENFSNSIKLIKDFYNITPPKENGCVLYFKNFMCKKKPLIEVKFELDIKRYVLNLRRLLNEFFKNNLKIMETESFESILNLEKLENKIQEVCFNKYQYLSEIYCLEEKLKDEVDKYSNYFNLDKIILKQNTKIKNQKKKIEKQEECKTAIDCIICMENERNLVFYPCMHFIVCEDCGNNKIKADCPQCHKIIDRKDVVLI